MSALCSWSSSCPVYSTALRYVTGSMATVGGGFLLTQSLAGDRHPEEPRSGVSKDEPRPLCILRGAQERAPQDDAALQSIRPQLRLDHVGGLFADHDGRR